MRLTVRAEGREVDISLDQDDTEALRVAERTALRLIGALPPALPAEEMPFGFAVSADTERADPEPPPTTED
ncbi:hypothetical protein [Streptomyces ipomoeae]|uniref:hypothetical protein n=1 Tax=Streptomyces ipomoeae TaxID=103232 RepID=UPI0011469A39|nr:hypothetical protein [Streptomyces ipomoeae]TQE33062.1 hypothetical protein Sipo7851_21400 [Streptomyces ipomoeae]